MPAVVWSSCRHHIRAGGWMPETKYSFIALLLAEAEVAFRGAALDWSGYFTLTRVAGEFEVPSSHTYEPSMDNIDTSTDPVRSPARSTVSTAACWTALAVSTELYEISVASSIIKWATPSSILR